MVVSTLYLCGGPLLCIIDTCYQERAFPTRLAYIVILHGCTTTRLVRNTSINSDESGTFNVTGNMMHPNMTHYTAING